MPAPFAKELLGYRVKNGAVTPFPNTSDSNDKQSVYLGEAMLEEIGVAPGTPGPTDPGGLLEVRTIEHLSALRPDLEINRARAVRDFLQYGHMGVSIDFINLYARGAAKRKSLLAALEEPEAPSLMDARQTKRVRAMELLRTLLQSEQEAFDLFQEQQSHEDLLRLDITVATDVGAQWPELRVALSAKWSLRTDRGQDGVSQGAKLAAQKRGRMPHFALITAEPRPAMLKIPSDGPSVDCVYHLDLGAVDRALTRRADGNPNWSPKVTFDRLVRQGRLRDYDDLVKQVMEVPYPMEEAVPETESVSSD